MKVLRKIIEIDEELCDGCGQCVPACAEGALQLVDGKARVVQDRYCDGLGACIGDCPTGALKIIEREAEEFDEVAVEAFLREQEEKEGEADTTTACGCPSAQIRVFAPYAPEAEKTDAEITGEEAASALTHWPIQIRLIPPTAPFLKNADLLVLADCSAVAFPALHPKLLSGKVVMMGCPKFDDSEEYISRFADIFRIAGVRSITTAFMEVPCCSALPAIVKKGVEKAGVEIPLTEIVISRKGGVVS